MLFLLLLASALAGPFGPPPDRDFDGSFDRQVEQHVLEEVALDVLWAQPAREVVVENELPLPDDEVEPHQPAPSCAAPRRSTRRGC